MIYIWNANAVISLDSAIFGFVGKRKKLEEYFFDPLLYNYFMQQILMKKISRISIVYKFSSSIEWVPKTAFGNAGKRINFSNTSRESCNYKSNNFFEA